jgi:o-succinylbenzoate synthase
VNVARVTWRPFAIPFVTRYETAGGGHACREGAVLRVECEDGTVGLGEVSPLPGFGGGRLGDCLVVLGRWASQFLGLTPEQGRLQLSRLAEHNTHVPALLFGLETALLDAEARRRDVPLATLLAPPRRRSVAVNATVAAAGAAEAARAASAAVDDGFGCVKLKVGMAGSTAAEVARLERVRAAIGPNVDLRADANGAWTAAQAVAVLLAARGVGLSLIEQPVARADIAGLARVRHESGVPVAADEAVGSLADARAVLAAGAADALVLKPTVIGGLKPCRRIVDEATATGVAVIVTSTLEAGIGLAAALQLAATLPDGAPACGLATAALLGADLLRASPSVVDGAIALPEGPGLGVRLDEAQLAQHATAPWTSS